MNALRHAMAMPVLAPVLAMAAMAIAVPGRAATIFTTPVAAGFDAPASFTDWAPGGSTYHLTVFFPATSTPVAINLNFGGQVRYWQNVGVYREFDTPISINQDLCAAGGCQIFADRVVARITLPGPARAIGPECDQVMMVQCRFSYGPFAVQLDHAYQSSAAGVVRIQAYAAGVPDMATWSAMLLGLFGVGSIARRRSGAGGAAARAALGVFTPPPRPSSHGR